MSRRYEICACLLAVAWGIFAWFYRLLPKVNG